jgi:hypothetical protein
MASPSEGQSSDALVHSTHHEQLDAMVELAQICHFCGTFQAPLKLPVFSRTVRFGAEGGRGRRTIARGPRQLSSSGLRGSMDGCWRLPTVPLAPWLADVSAPWWVREHEV